MDAKQKMNTGTGTGIGVDANGQPVIDPTANVLALVQASVERLNDLRTADNAKHDSDVNHIREMAMLRAEHEHQLSLKESERLNSIRQVDVLNQAAAAKSALDAIQALAATTTANAENIRNSLSVTAQQMAKQTTDLAATLGVQTAATTSALGERIAALEKAAAEGVGKGRVLDPAMQSLVSEVQKLTTSGGRTEGKSEGIGAAWVALLGAVTLISLLLGIGAVVYEVASPKTATAPQIIYAVPAPTAPAK